MGDLSRHFSRSEFRCHHCGQLGDEAALRDLVVHLEVLRGLVGRPLVIVSGYRCPTHDRRVRRKRTTGQHAQMTAVDLKPGVVTEAQAERAGFRGIGMSGRWATHVDRRQRRARWWY